RCVNSSAMSLRPQAAADIAEEFTHRRWHENVECKWNGESLILTAENDFDAEGRALTDEFSDAIAACSLTVSTDVFAYYRSQLFDQPACAEERSPFMRVLTEAITAILSGLHAGAGARRMVSVIPLGSIYREEE